MTFEEIQAIADEHGIDGDSHAYELLHRSAIDTSEVSGIVCEIGVRRGLGSLTMMLSGPPHKTYIGIDPYGDIEYHWRDNQTVRFDYSNSVKLKFLKEIYDIASQHNINYHFFNLTDAQFFHRYADGIPVYNGQETIVNDYSLILFDGPHTTTEITTEINFFIPKTSIGGIFIFDDVEGYYDHNVIDTILLENNFSLREHMINKKAYIKNA